MNFKGDFTELGYLNDESCFFLYYYIFNGRPLWGIKTCKEEFGYSAKQFKNLQFLFLVKHDLDKLVEKFNEYAEKIGLVSRAELDILENRFGKTYPVVVVNDTSNPLEREGAAILIKTLYWDRVIFLNNDAEIKRLKSSAPYFSGHDNLYNVFLNWKEFVSGVTVEQLDACYYEFGFNNIGRGHGGLINWLQHIFEK